MKRVMCIREGHQKGLHPVQVGSIYTVTDVLEAWEVYKDEGQFYMLAERSNDRAYCSSLFADLPNECEEMEEEEEAVKEFTSLLNHKR